MPKGMKNMRTLLLMIFAALSLSVSAQTITLNGNVKDTTGEPIIGASIVEKGNTSNGTITNLDGDFSLKVPANATLIVSYCRHFIYWYENAGNRNQRKKQN